MKFGLYGFKNIDGPYYIRVMDGVATKINLGNITRGASMPSQAWNKIIAVPGDPFTADRNDLRLVPLFDTKLDARFTYGVPYSVEIYGLDCEPFFPADRREWMDRAAHRQERITLCRSYGVLCAEKRPVYTVGRPASDVYDSADYLLPPGWRTTKNAAGELLFCDPDGGTWLSGDILTTWGDAPALRWFDGQIHRRAILISADWAEGGDVE